MIVFLKRQKLWQHFISAIPNLVPKPPASDIAPQDDFEVRLKEWNNI